MPGTIAELIMGNDTFKVLKADFSYFQQLQLGGRVSSDIRGGTFTIEIESSVGSKFDMLANWMTSKSQMQKGVIRFYRDDGIGRFFDLEFYDAYCIKYKEQFNYFEAKQLRTIMTISPGITRVRDLVQEKPWKVSDLSNALSFENSIKSRISNDRTVPNKSMEDVAFMLGGAGDKADEYWANFTYEDFGKKPLCFAKGTIVKTPEGDKLIEELETGSKIYSFDFNLQIPVISSIAAVRRNFSENMLNLHILEEDILVTGSHLFYVEDWEKWIQAKDIDSAMKIKTFHGFQELSCRAEYFNKQIDTFDIEIIGSHNYFVGRVGLLVHNSNSIFSDTTKIHTQIYEIYEINSDGTPGKTIYGGKVSDPGNTGRDHKTRFSEHCHDAKKALDKSTHQCSPVDEGEWTRYETAVKEKQFIEIERAQGSPVINVANPISRENFEKFKKLHNPCK